MIYKDQKLQKSLCWVYELMLLLSCWKLLQVLFYPPEEFSSTTTDAEKVIAFARLLKPNITFPCCISSNFQQLPNYRSQKLEVSFFLQLSDCLFDLLLINKTHKKSSCPKKFGKCADSKTSKLYSRARKGGVWNTKRRQTGELHKDCSVLTGIRLREFSEILKAKEVTKYENDSIHCPISQLDKVQLFFFKIRFNS